MRSTYHNDLIQRNQKHLNRQKEVGKMLMDLHDSIGTGITAEGALEKIKLIVEMHKPFFGEFPVTQTG